MQKYFYRLFVLSLVLCLGCQNLFKSYQGFNESGETSSPTPNTALTQDSITIELKAGKSLTLRCRFIEVDTERQFIYFPAGAANDEMTFLCQKESPDTGIVSIKIKAAACVLSAPRFIPQHSKKIHPTINGAEIVFSPNAEESITNIIVSCNQGTDA